MPNIIISKTILTTAKKKLLQHKENPSGWTEEQLKAKVREAIEEEMNRKEEDLDTVDKQITFLLATCHLHNHSINDLLSIDIGD